MGENTVIYRIYLSYHPNICTYIEHEGIQYTMELGEDIDPQSCKKSWCTTGILNIRSWILFSLSEYEPNHVHGI